MNRVIDFSVIHPEFAAQTQHRVRNCDTFFHQRAGSPFHVGRRVGHADAARVIPQTKVVAHEIAVAFFLRKEAFDDAGDWQLSADAEEGFCELIAHLVQKEVRDEAGMRQIAANKYTRGQFELFRQAQETYNLLTVIDWLKYGPETRLTAEDLDMVRRAQQPAQAPPRLWVARARSVDSVPTGGEAPRNEAEDELRLKAVMGSDKRRTALINHRSLQAGETAKLTVAGTQREIRCLEIGPDFVRIEFLDDAEQRTLRLPAAAAR